jgi:hypothetical protein
VRLVGSRAEGREHALSDWDLRVTTDDFARVAGDLPGLLETFEPLAQQWDPYADHAAYVLMFPGPTKLDLCFFDEQREWAPPYEVRPDTLEAIDRHFWDWILWIEQKRRGGYGERVEEVLGDLYELMLLPMGVDSRPESIRDALEAYLQARDRLETYFGVNISRRLEHEVRPVVSG